MKKKGFLIYAHNNEEIDYGKIALCCSLMLKAHLDENRVCLVTDQGTFDWLLQSMGRALVDEAFDHVKIIDWTFKDGATTRRFQDTASTQKNLMWFNGSRNTAYELSPFDETILLDCDVLIQDNMFDQVWGSTEDVLINGEAVTLEHKPPKPGEQRLDSVSIKMYWATMIYFRKSETAKLLFNLVSHIKEKYEYYRYVYEFPGRMYRNDFAFSIAIHMLNGYLENNEFKPFPQKKILTSFDDDELIEVRDRELVFLVSDSENTWRFRLNRVRDVTVHVMNKYSILRLADKLIELYRHE
jgi:hypothetical protein